MMRRYEQLVARGTVLFGGIVLTLMMVQIAVDVIMRRFFGAGFPATPDLVGKYYMVALAVVPIAFTEVKRRHIEATIFTDQLPARVRNWFGMPGFVLSALIYGLLTYAGTVDALRQTAKGAYIDAGLIKVLTWPSYWLMPLAFGLMTVLCAIRIVQLATGKLSVHAHDPLEELNADLEEEV